MREGDSVDWDDSFPPPLRLSDVARRAMKKKNIVALNLLQEMIMLTRRSRIQYSASVKSSSLDQVARALAILGQTLQSDRKLASIIGAPTLTTADKKEVVAELQKLTGGSDKGDTLKNFLTTLAENNRLGVLENVCEKFGTLMGAHRGELDLSITSAQELDSKSISRLEKAVSKSEYSQGKKLKVVTNVCFPPCISIGF